ncbi:MAG: hypothetical protein K8T89_06960 [Planctomycetes bacterium]|nr:hypothetical protein [Planctomycetota bacterium]
MGSDPIEAIETDLLTTAEAAAVAAEALAAKSAAASTEVEAATSAEVKAAAATKLLAAEASAILLAAKASAKLLAAAEASAAATKLLAATEATATTAQAATAAGTNVGSRNLSELPNPLLEADATSTATATPAELAPAELASTAKLLTTAELTATELATAKLTTTELATAKLTTTELAATAKLLTTAELAATTKLLTTAELAAATTELAAAAILSTHTAATLLLRNGQAIIDNDRNDRPRRECRSKCARPRLGSELIRGHGEEGRHAQQQRGGTQCTWKRLEHQNSLASAKLFGWSRQHRLGRNPRHRCFPKVANDGCATPSRLRVVTNSLTYSQDYSQIITYPVNPE